MKKIILSAVLLGVLSLTACKKSDTNLNTEVTNTQNTSNIESTSFGVRGNCGMCKNTIEKAINSISGISSANWDVNKKKVNVSYNPELTDVNAIHNAIAASGYDTDKVLAKTDAYDNLPGCCQYDHKMAMSN